MKSMHHHSRGIALLTTLLVVSIATIICVSMIKRQWIDIRKTENVQRVEQGWLYAQGIDAWAVARLQEDITNNKTDSEQDVWSQPIEPTQVEGGQLSATITDYQGRFNINNLLATGDAGKKYLGRFQRLLIVLDLPQQLADALLDWLDANGETRYPSGAEDSHYMAKTPPYRPANQAMVDLSELRLIEGFTEEVCQVLEPNVSALPGIVDINVNTAPEPVLRSMSRDISQQDAQLIIETRSEKPFEDMASFMSQQALAGRTVVAEGLGVSSKYFTVAGNIQIGQQRFGYRSIIYREDKDKIRVIQRVKRGFFDE